MKSFAGLLTIGCITLSACAVQSDYKILEPAALKGEKAVWVQLIYSEDQKMFDNVQTTLFGELKKQKLPLSSEMGVLQIKIWAWLDYYFYYGADETGKSDDLSSFTIEIYKNSKLIMVIQDGKMGNSSWRYHCEEVIPRMVAALKKATK